MSFGDPNNPYGQQPQQPPQPQGNPYGQQPQQPGYPQAAPQQQPGYPQAPQGAPQGVPPQGYGYPQQQPAQPYGYPQQQQPGQPYGAYPQQGGPGGYGQYPQAGSGAPASMGKRLGARLIDGVLLGVITSILSAIGVIGSASSVSECDPAAADYSTCVSDASSTVMASTFAMVGVVYLIAFLYEWLMIATVGATLGKMAVGIRVVNSENGGPAGFGGGAVRYLIVLAGVIACGIGQLLVYLSPFWDKSGRLQGWHDKVAKTAVVTK